MRVVGISSAPRSVPGFDSIHPARRARRGGRASAIISCCSRRYTPATLGIVGDAVFGAMKPGSYFINLGRGETWSTRPR